MAVLPMQKINLVAMKRDRKQIMDFLQRRGVVELTTPETSSGVFTPVDSNQVLQELEKNLSVTQNAIKIVSNYAEVKSSSLAFLQGPTYKTVAEYDAFFEEGKRVLEDAENICDLELRLQEYKGDMIRQNALREELVPWQALPLPLNYTGTKNTTCFVGALSGVYTLGELQEKLITTLATVSTEAIPVHLEVISSDTQQTCIYVFTLNEHRDILKEALDQLDFHYPAQRIEKIPADAIAELEEQTANALQESDRLRKEIIEYESSREDLLFLSDQLSIEIEKNRAMNSLSQSRHTFLLEGYIVAENSSKLEEELTNSYDCILTFEDLSAVDNPPVQLRNNRFSEPTESVVASYSLPGPREVDPTSVMSIFYYIMFGLMFSDAGYGLLLVGVIGFLLLKFRNMEDSMKKSLRMFFWCGVSTLFWGLIFGTFFGDVVNAVSRTFFGNATFALKPIWFDPVQNPMKLLMFSMGLGVIHLTTGYIMNAVTSIKNKNHSAVVYDAVFPVAFIFSILIAFSTTDIFKSLAGFKTEIPSMVVSVCLGIAILCCVGTVLFAGRESKNWAKRIMKGLYGLYNMVSGWLSDILSYSRLLALGLATGIIGTVINTLGTLAGGGILGLIVFLLAFVLGHALNFGINILGAYVHSNRLEYVEFFGKFYEGGGRQFRPLGIHTKAYKIREE